MYIRAIMALTPKQEKFAQLVASGTNQSDAYRQAYNAENMQGKTINERASVLAKQDNVATRIAELQKPIIAKTQYTLESYIDKMNEISEQALAKGDFSPAAKALENVGKVLGFYTNKTELSGPGGGPVSVQLVKKIIEWAILDFIERRIYKPCGLTFPANV